MVQFFIKLGCSAAFLVVMAVPLVVSGRVQKLAADRFSDVPRAALRAQGYSLLFLFGSFVSLWLLTRLFPIALFPVLFGFALIGAAIGSVLGSITGISLPEVQNKFRALTVIWGAHKPWLGCTWALISGVVYLGATLGSLIVFWAHPIADPVAQVWVVLLLLVIPTVVISAAKAPMYWAPITSEFLDDDVRNTHLVTGFTSIFSGFVALVYPFWLIERQFPTAFGIATPSYWTLLMIPVSIFCLGYLVPFFAGVYRFRHQAKLMRDQRNHLLQDLLETSKLEIGSELRNQRLDAAIERLSAELESQSSKNELLSFYLDMEEQQKSEDTHDQNSLPYLHDDDGDEDIQEDEDAGEYERAVVPTDLQADSYADDDEEDLQSLIRGSRSWLMGMTGVETTSENQSEDPMSRYEAIIRENRTKLIEWDLRFSHLMKLLDIIEIAEEGRNKDISGFIDVRLKAQKTDETTNHSKNVLAGLILSGFSGIGILLAKVFEDPIVDFIGSLVKVT